MHLQQISSTINISLDLLKMLNPQYLMQIIPATSKKYALTLPVECICEYLEHEKEIHAKDSMYLKEYVIHANLEKKRKEVPQMQKSSTSSSSSATKYHTVAEGETLGAIAIKYKVTTKQIVEWNKLSNPDALSIGQKLRVSAITSKSTTTTTKASSTTKYHTVADGDTLGAIAIKYKVTTKQIVEWNKLSNPDALRIGQKLRVSK
jgi:LysM repeat protein